MEDLSAAKRQISRLGHELQEATGVLADLQNRIQDLEANLKASKMAQADANLQQQQATSELNILKTELEAKDSQLNAVQSSRDQMEQEIRF